MLDQTSIEFSFLWIRNFPNLVWISRRQPIGLVVGSFVWNLISPYASISMFYHYRVWRVPFVFAVFANSLVHVHIVHADFRWPVFIAVCVWDKLCSHLQILMMMPHNFCRITMFAPLGIRCVCVCQLVSEPFFLRWLLRWSYHWWMPPNIVVGIFEMSCYLDVQILHLIMHLFPNWSGIIVNHFLCFHLIFFSIIFATHHILFLFTRLGFEITNFILHWSNEFSWNRPLWLYNDFPFNLFGQRFICQWKPLFTSLK